MDCSQGTIPLARYIVFLAILFASPISFMCFAIHHQRGWWSQDSIYYTPTDMQEQYLAEKILVASLMLSMRHVPTE